LVSNPTAGGGGLGTINVGPHTIQNSSTGVNGLLLLAGATGQALQLQTQGADANIGAYFISKGTGFVRAMDGNGAHINELHNGTNGDATFAGTVYAGKSGTLTTSYGPAAVAISGSVTDQTLYVDAKGTGGVAFNGNSSATGGVQVYSGSVDVVTAGKGLKVAEGSNAKQLLTAAMTGTPGSIVTANTSVTANSRIIYSRAVPGGTLGHLSCSIIASTSFTILSTGNETSTFFVEIFEPG
jgi:hypothetical protein